MNMKERSQATWNIIPLKNIPTRFIIEMVVASAVWINMFPPTDGITIIFSPRTLVTGLQVKFKKIVLSLDHISKNVKNVPMGWPPEQWKPFP